ncbi:hypothetical protein MY11210_001508 [Beauveria gryllotalpidicola]
MQCRQKLQSFVNSRPHNVLTRIAVLLPNDGKDTLESRVTVKGRNGSKVVLLGLGVYLILRSELLSLESNLLKSLKSFCRLSCFFGFRLCLIGCESTLS